jgi:hypothetical protein
LLFSFIILFGAFEPGIIRTVVEKYNILRRLDNERMEWKVCVWFQLLYFGVHTKHSALTRRNMYWGKVKKCNTLHGFQSLT